MILNIGTCVKDDKNDLYILDEIVGQGGFGYVFKAHRERDDAIFAIKTMLPSFGDSSLEEAFRNEMQSTSGIQDKNIIHYEYIHNGNDFPELPPYIIMEFADGGTLNSLLEQSRKIGKPFELNVLVDIFRQLASGMKAINRKLVHRDIKPDNILLCGDTWKIADFGLSKIAAENTRTMTFKGGGTFQYMAPEAFDYTKNTVQMDIYSMGIVFYELATLRYPYNPIPYTYEECKNAHMCTAITSLQTSSNPLPENLVSIINRMLEKPSQRRFTDWQSILELLDSPSETNTPFDKIVAAAILSKNAQDRARQKQESDQRQKEIEKTEHCQLVRSQFDNDIDTLLQKYIKTINLQYAGIEKISISAKRPRTQRGECFGLEMIVPPSNFLTFDMEILFKENHKREVAGDRIWNEGRTRTECYIPQYKDKNILAWGAVANKSGYGFNILLVDSGELFGDWIIMKNKNNFSKISGKVRPEPFAFSLQELPKEINLVQITHLYSADFVPLCEDSFLQLVNVLAFPSI
ncbi:MAG: serine/threonine-protein kinase [Christensenellaceae bacterium]|jgi:serine/threonine protein kinase